MEYRDKILSLARTQPILPSAVAKELDTNTIMAGAMLSEMCDKGILKVSRLKVGGSPLYYLPGNESQLLNHINNLNEKDRRTANKLQQEKIIREKDADPLTQVSLKQIKDFAQPLTVTYNNQQETFWKWFDVDDNEARQLIKQHLEPVQQEPPKIEQPAPQPKTAKKETETQPKAEPIKKPKQEKTTSESTGEFWNDIEHFFTTNNIKLVEKTMVKKKTEFDLLVELPSPVGTLSYYCKARKKQKITDGDISAAYVQGQLKKLPILFITNGELTKKARDVLSKLNGITLKQL